MIGTLKTSLKKILTLESSDWEPLSCRTVFLYRPRGLKDVLSPFHFMYSRRPRLAADPISVTGTSHQEEAHYTESLCTENLRCSRTLVEYKHNLMQHFFVDNKVLVARETVMSAVKKSSFFETEYYGPCTIVWVAHTSYRLISLLALYLYTWTLTD